MFGKEMNFKNMQTQFTHAATETYNKTAKKGAELRKLLPSVDVMFTRKKKGGSSLEKTLKSLGLLREY